MTPTESLPTLLRALSSGTATPEQIATAIDEHVRAVALQVADEMLRCPGCGMWLLPACGDSEGNGETP